MDSFTQAASAFQRSPLDALVAAVERLANSQRSTVQAVRLLSHGFLPDGDVFYEVPLQTMTEIREIHLLNKDGSAREFTMWLLPPGEITADEHLIYVDEEIAAGDYLTLPMTRVIEAGWVIYTAVSSADKITCHISGTEIATR